MQNEFTEFEESSLSTRKEALSAGKDRYFTGAPCSKGHVCERYTCSYNCVECQKISGDDWKVKNPKRITKASSTYNIKYRDRANAKRIFKMEKEAGRPRPYLCEVCGYPELVHHSRTGDLKKLSFDHDHATGKFRGWLCHGCNIALGAVSDRPEVLLKLAEYLLKL